MYLRARSSDQILDHQNIWLWIQACNVRHAERCISPPAAPRQPAQMPDWLIDTTEACLVPGYLADKYTALSYVWPSPAPSLANALLLERDTLSQFCTPGFFLDDYNIARIPPIIRDAIRLAKGLDERFIWVDRLCLLQNDNETYAQVQRMHEIYWGAYVTIIAATSGSIYGRGDRVQHSGPDQREPWFPPQHATSDSSWSAYHLALMNEHYTRLSNSKWGTRGWTYQEKILSRRTVILLDDDMFWDCQCALWDCNGLDPFTETTLQANQAEDELRSMNMRLTPSMALDFSLYVELVCPYNARDLTYPQDVVPAFTGILNTLAPAFPGGFVAGIPLAYLNHALLWQPRGSALRRKGTTNPSWSWTGWRCEIDPWSLRSGLSMVAGQPSALQRAGTWLVREAAESFVVSTEASYHVTSEQVRAGQVQVQQDEAICFNYVRGDGSVSLGDPVRLGPVPREASPIDALLFIQTRNAFFTVRSKEAAFQEPPEAQVRFRESLSQPPKPALGGGLFGALPSTGFGAPSSAFMFGSVPKVSVYESSFSTSLEAIGESSSLILSGKEGKFAGVIRMLDNRQSIGATVEVIALSLGSVRYIELDAEYEQNWRQERSQHPHPRLEESGSLWPRLRNLLSAAEVSSINNIGGDPPIPNLSGPLRTESIPGFNRELPCLEDDGMFEFYNVLLIERKGDIACRRGCGRVPRRIWEESALPSQRFLLG